MRGMHAAILCLLAALALSGCASRSGPVAAMQPRSKLDSLAYGQSYGPAPRARGRLRSHRGRLCRRGYANGL